MKVCDIADWFGADFANVVSNELREVPRFHRKQWEFAQIFIALKEAGVLREDATGLSMGAGRELLLYALANHVGRLWATDIYTSDTEWDTARATDIDDFVKNNPLIPTRPERISVKNMDMRRIDFADQSFDFAYSSSAVEHIGGWDDFRTHLNEVRRVLKPGGKYVLTTDIIYGPAWEQTGNYKFTPEGLAWWLRESGMAFDPVVDCRIARHYSNMPLPSDVGNLLISDANPNRLDLFGCLAHAQNLMARYPHSSVILTMRKAAPDRQDVAFPGYTETMAFLCDMRNVWETIAHAPLVPNPWSLGRVEQSASQWATAYMALGLGQRQVRVRVKSVGSGRITIGVNRNHNDDPAQTIAEITERIEQTNGDTDLELTIYCRNEWSYSIYGRSLDGLRLDDVVVRIGELQDRFVEATPWDPNAEAESWTCPAIELQPEWWMMHYTSLGFGARRLRVRIKTDQAGSITIGVNRYHQDNPSHIVVDVSERPMTTAGQIDLDFTIYGMADWLYAAYGRTLDGVRLETVIVHIGDANPRFADSEASDRVIALNNPWSVVPASQTPHAWQTAHLALGDRPRRIKVRVMTNGPGSITVGVNRISTQPASKPVVDKPEKIVAITGSVDLTFTVDCEPDWSYVIHGRSLNDVLLTRVVVWLGEPERDVFADDAGNPVTSGERPEPRHPTLNGIRSHGRRALDRLMKPYPHRFGTKSGT